MTQKVVLALAMFLAALPCAASELLWSEYYDAGNQAVERKDLAGAEKIYRFARKQAMTNEQEFLTNLALGRTLTVEGKVPEAEPFLEDAVNLGASLSAEGHEANMDEALSLLHDAYLRQDKTALAAGVQKKRIKHSQSHQIKPQNNGGGSQHPVTEAWRKGRELYLKGDYAGAEPHLEFFLAWYRDYSFEPPNKDWAAMLYHSYRRQKQLDKAEKLCEQLLQEEKAKHGMTTVYSAELLLDLAGIYCDRGEKEKSESNCQQALEILKALNSADSQRLLALAISYMKRDKATEVRPIIVSMLKQDLERLPASQKRPGNTTPIEERINAAVAILIKAGYVEDAQSTLDELLPIEETLHDNDAQVGVTLAQMAALATMRGDYPQAEERVKKAIDIHTRTDGKWSIKVAFDKRVYANLLERSGRLDDANQMRAQADEIEQKHSDWVE